MSIYHKNLNKVLAGWKEITGEPVKGLKSAAEALQQKFNHYKMMFFIIIFIFHIFFLSVCTGNSFRKY